MIIGFILLVSACGSDYCDALPVSERVMTFNECQNWITLIHEKRPKATLLCAPVNEEQPAATSGFFTPELRR